MSTEIDNRLLHAQKVAHSFKLKYDAGEVNILEYNKAQLHYTVLKAELENTNTNKALLLSELQSLNNNKPISLNQTNLPTNELNNNYDNWYSQAQNRNPELLQIQQEKTEADLEIKLSKSENLPSFSVGYVSEQSNTDAFRGAVVGVSIPLWENKNTVKAARLKYTAINDKEVNAKQSFYNELREYYFKVKMLQKTLEHYQTIISNYNNTPLLEKAFNNGQISLIEYMQELSLYYEVINKKLELEKEINLAYSYLYIYE